MTILGETQVFCLLRTSTKTGGHRMLLAAHVLPAGKQKPDSVQRPFQPATGPAVGN